MEVKNINTVFVKSNEWCINLKTQQPAQLAGSTFKAPVPVEIISEGYTERVNHNNKSYDKQFVNVTDGIHKYRVLINHIKQIQ